MSFLLSNLIICRHIIYQMQNEFILMHFLVVGIFFGRKIENYSKASKVIILFKPMNGMKIEYLISLFSL
jgi:hypothetical protein